MMLLTFIQQMMIRSFWYKRFMINEPTENRLGFRFESIVDIRQELSRFCILKSLNKAQQDYPLTSRHIAGLYTPHRLSTARMLTSKFGDVWHILSFVIS